MDDSVFLKDFDMMYRIEEVTSIIHSNVYYRIARYEPKQEYIFRTRWYKTDKYVDRHSRNVIKTVTPGDIDGKYNSAEEVLITYEKIKAIYIRDQKDLVPPKVKTVTPNTLKTENLLGIK